MEKTEIIEQKYIVCDGCGYVVSSKSDAYITLTVKKPGEDTLDLHFHYPMQEGEKRSWGSSDCLGYWYQNRAARELAIAKPWGSK